MEMGERAKKLERYEWMLNDPESARHLLSLLMQGKGSRDDFERMIDRIVDSKAKAEGRSNG